MGKCKMQIAISLSAARLIASLLNLSEPGQVWHTWQGWQVCQAGQVCHAVETCWDDQICIADKVVKLV